MSEPGFNPGPPENETEAVTTQPIWLVQSRELNAYI